MVKPGARVTAPFRALCFALALYCAGCGRESLEVTFVDVGQGDAVLVRTPGGEHVLVDAGASDPSSELTKRNVERIDLLIASHPHSDHIGGMDEVVETFTVLRYLDSGIELDSDAYREVQYALAAESSSTLLDRTPGTLELGEASIEVLPIFPYAQNANDASVATLFRYGEFSVLLTGDAEGAALDYLVRIGAVPDVTVLKASHHGSDNGVTEALLGAAKPEVVVISVGGGNAHGHPGSAALAAYYNAAADVYRTDLDGSVTVRGFRDGSYRIATER